MNPKRRWGAGVAGAVLLGVALLAWREESASQQPAAAPNAEPTVSRAEARPAPPAVTASLAAASAPLSPSATPQSEAARLAAEHRQRQLADGERHWCSSAKATHQQLTHAKRQAVPEFDPRNVKAFADAVEASAKGEVSLGREAQAQVRERLLSQWAQQLQPRGDPASRRVRLWLGAAHTVPGLEQGASRAALKALFEATGDVQAYALWLHASGFCAQGRHCSAEDRRRWAAVEPGNVIAWLPAPGHSEPLTPERWQGLARTQFARDPLREVVAVLLPLVPSEPGLPMEQGLAFLHEVQTAIAPASDLALLCETASSAEQRRSCVQAAGVLARQPAVAFTDRLFAQAIQAYFGEPGGATPVLEQVQKGLSDLLPEQKALLRDLMPARRVQRPGCDHLPAWRAQLRQVSEAGSAAMVDALAPPR